MEDPSPAKRNRPSSKWVSSSTRSTRSTRFTRHTGYTPFAALVTLPELPGLTAMAAKLLDERQTECYPFAVHEQSLRVLRQLVRVVRNPNLNRFLCDVFGEPEFRRWILIDRSERPSTVLPRIGAAAHRAQQMPGADTYAKETLYCATVVARLLDILELRASELEHTAVNWRDPGQAYSQHMTACILKLEAVDAYAAWVMRVVIGMPNDEALRSVEAAVLMSRVRLAWIQTLAADPQLRIHPWIPYQS